MTLLRHGVGPIAVWMLLCSVCLGEYDPDRDPDLIRRWTFDGNGADVASTAEMTPQGTSIDFLRGSGTGEAKVFEKAALNGSDEYFTSGISTGLGSTWSITGWILGSPLSGKGVFCASDEVGNNDRGLVIKTHTSGKLRVLVSHDGTSSNLLDKVTSQVFQLQTEWAHFAVTFNAGTIKVYKNGVEDTMLTDGGTQS